MHLSPFLPDQTKKAQLSPPRHIHLYTHNCTHTHRTKRRDNSQQRSCVWGRCETAWRNGPWGGRVEKAKAQCVEGACWWEAGWFAPQNPRKAQEFQALDTCEVEVRVRLQAGRLTECLFPRSLPTYSQQSGSYPSLIPVGDGGFRFQGDWARDLDPGAPGTVRTGVFTENRN